MSATQPPAGSAARDERRRGGACLHDFGVWRRADEQLRACWHEQSGELRAEAGNHDRSRLLARLPASGHPDRRRSDLIAEAALHGWRERCGRPNSLDWLERRLAELRAARLEPIDWTVACAHSGCPRQGEPIAPDSGEWGETCDGCLRRRLLRAHNLTPSQLEAALRAGRWQLADANSARGRRPA